jgi:threonine dehydrogenase-like Zn-dependent dehydrogenase
MRAAYLLNKTIEVGTIDDPVPGAGQVLVRTRSCGICASDLHMCQHGHRLVEWSQRHGGLFNIDFSRPVVLGHEYVAEIIDYGPETERTLPKGTLVTSLPIVPMATGKSYVGNSNEFPGGFGEYMVLSEELLNPIPDTCDVDIAAMSEPLSVGIGYVALARMTKDDVPLVVGCGAIGLAMVMALKLAGAGPIIAADFSQHRRQMAYASGADIVIDAAEISAYLPQQAFGGKVPNLVFECVGVPGVLDGIIQNVAPLSRILVAGWCLEEDRIFSGVAHNKRLNVQFGGGSSPDAFTQAVHAICEGKVDPGPWIGGKVGLSSVADALFGITDPANPIRVVVDPSRD